LKKNLPQSVEEMTDIIDIEGILHSSTVSMLKTALIIFIVVIVVLALSYILIKLWKKWQQRRLEELLSPDERALRNLADLRKVKHIENSKWPLFYFSLDEILRRYIFARFDCDVLDKTYEEIKVMLSKKGTHNSFLDYARIKDIKNLSQFWERAQLIKFAKIPSTVDDCQKDFEMVKGFVVQSKEEEGARRKAQ